MLLTGNDTGTSIVPPVVAALAGWVGAAVSAAVAPPKSESARPARNDRRLILAFPSR